MSPTEQDQFARLEVAAVTGQLPRDLGAWLVFRLAAELATAERRAERDELLRQASRLIQGTVGDKVREIRREAARLNRRPMISIRRDFPGLLSLAMQRNGGQLPGDRQLRRILSG
jgi:hypothetical protein